MSRANRIVEVLVAGLMAASGSDISAQTFSDPGFVIETVATLPPQLAVGITWAPDGRAFLWQKDGVVRILKNGILLPAPFLDFHTRVNQVEDRGMLGLALDPNFAANGYIYLAYVYEEGGNPNDADRKTSRVTRVQADPAAPDRVLAGSEVVLLGSIGTPPCSNYPAGSDCIPVDSTSHSVGALRFAPDGKLFFSHGDGTDFNGTDVNALRAQDLNTYSGKILRINPDGSAPGDNPFDTGSDDVRSKVWAYGLHDPYRYGLDPKTGLPWIGDVGGKSYEEIDRGVRGANYGWPCYEGKFPQTGYRSEFTECQQLLASAVTFPIATWDHGSGGAAIAGTFYMANQYPKQYQGNLFFADAERGWIRRMAIDARGNATRVSSFLSGISGPVDIETGPDGMLYFVAKLSGEVGRIRYTNGSPPVALISATPVSGSSPVVVGFSSDGTFDPAGLPLTYLWNFGDGTTSTLPHPTHIYTAIGVATFTASLTVSNSRNFSSESNVKITVGSPLLSAATSTRLLAEPRALAAPKRVFMAPDDHTDYFWSGTDTDYEQYFLTMLDYYLDQADATASQPPDWQSRFSADGSLWLKSYEKNRSPAQIQRLVDRMNDGHISAPLNPLVISYGGVPAEAVLRSMYYAGQFERRYGVDLPLAIQMEDSTLPYGLNSLWAGSGATYSWKGICNCPSLISNPTNRANEIYRSLGPDGTGVIMKWFTLYDAGNNESLGGYAEARAPSDALNKVTVGAGSNGFATRYPFDTIGVFGQGWDDVLTTNLNIQQNCKSQSDSTRECIVSDTVDFFNEFSANYGASLPAVQASFGNELGLGPAALAEVSARVKRSLEKLRTAEALATLVSRRNPAFLNGRDAAREKAFLDLGLYFEHNFENGGPHVDGATRIAWQRRVATEIESYTNTLASDAVTALGGMIQKSGSSPRFFIFNPLSWTRTDTADIPWNGSLPVHVVDILTGTETPSQIVNVSGAQYVRVQVPNVPSVGYKVIEIQQGAGQAFPNTPTASASSGVMENEFYKVTVSPRGAITSLVDKRLGNREMAGTTGGFALNDLGGTGGTLTIENAGPVSVTLVATSTSTLTHSTRVTLTRGSDRLAIKNEVTQNFGGTQSWKFSVNLTAPDVRSEEVGAIARARLTTNGGDYSTTNARYDFLTANHFADMTGSGAVGLTISNQDAYFMTVGKSTTASLDTSTPQISMILGMSTRPANPILNQAGDSYFMQRFALESHGPYDQAAAMRFSLEHQNPLTIGSVAGGSVYPEAYYSYLSISDPSVLLWALKPAEEGMSAGVIARVWNLASVPTSFSLNPSELISTAKTITHIEVDKGDAAVSNGALASSIAQQQLLSFRIFQASQIPPTGPAPTLSGLTPAGAMQGQALPVTLAGGNFQSGATCNFSSGITVNSCAFISAAQLTANISISAAAITGTRTVTVTNADGQSASLTSGFTVNQAPPAPPPSLTSLSPVSGQQAQTLGVTLTGTNFLGGATCGFGAGITVNSCSVTLSTQIAANITITGGAATGARSVTVTNPDGQSASLANAFTVNTAPPPPPPSSVNAAFSFNAGSGLTAADLSGNNNNGTLQNGVAWTTAGKYGNALSFDGVNDFVSVPDSPTLDLGSSGTIMAWVKLNTLNRWNSVLAKGDANLDPSTNYALEVNNGNRFVCILGSGASTRALTSTVTATTGAFYHLACVWNGTQLQLYINGVLNTSMTQNLTPAGNTSPLYIGQYGGNADRMSGVIDEARIYGRALSQAEVMTNMNSPLTP